MSIEILAAHGRPCPYCGTQMSVGHGRRKKLNRPNSPSRDHLIPKSLMPAQGTIVVCRRCNSDKGQLLLDEWEERLRAIGDPRAPIIRDFMKRNAHLKRSRDFKRL